MRRVDRDLPWVVYRYLTSYRMIRFTGRIHVELTCAICAARELRTIRVARFMAVPLPRDGQHIVHVAFKLAHLHKGRFNRIEWVKAPPDPFATCPSDEQLDEIECGLEAIAAVAAAR